jgi:formamidopyrimidine-DNA glycosylase
MPELPEVETMRRGISAAVGCRIEAATFPRHTRRPVAVTPPPAFLRRRLAGRTIAAAVRFGKRIALELAPTAEADVEWLIIEPRMTGLLLVVDPPTAVHVRLALELASPATCGPVPPRLLFWDRRGLGTIRLVDREGLAAQCGAGRLGPDGLVVTAADLAARLGRSSRAVKVALLDQRAVAGIGNIYAAEILHRAGIDPRVRCRRLAAPAWAGIAAAARRVLAAAVRLEGSTIGDATYLTADRRPGRFQRRHQVYGRAGRECRRCGATVERIVQAQRSTFFCPGCQWRPGRRSRTLQPEPRD